MEKESNNFLIKNLNLINKCIWVKANFRKLYILSMIDGFKKPTRKKDTKFLTLLISSCIKILLDLN